MSDKTKLPSCVFLGTRSTLLAKRIRDASRMGFRSWQFMSVHNWGEPAAGVWTLHIENTGYDGSMAFCFFLSQSLASILPTFYAYFLASVVRVIILIVSPLSSFVSILVS